MPLPRPVIARSGGGWARPRATWQSGGGGSITNRPSILPPGFPAGAGQRLVIRQILASLCLAATVAACAPQAPQPAASPGQTETVKPAKLTYAIVGFSWNNVPELVAEAKGFWDAEKLTVDTVVAGQSSAVCQQVTARAAE